MGWIDIHHPSIHAYTQKQTKFLYYPQRPGRGWVSRDGIITVPTHSTGHLDLLWAATHLGGQIRTQSTPRLCDWSSSVLGPFVTTALTSPRILFLSRYFSAHGLDSRIIRDVYKQLQISFFLTWTLFPLGKPLQLLTSTDICCVAAGKEGPISQTLWIKKEMMNSVSEHLAGVLSTVTHRAEGTVAVIPMLLLCYYRAATELLCSSSD